MINSKTAQKIHSVIKFAERVLSKDSKRVSVIVTNLAKESRPTDGSIFLMNGKLEHLERTILELGSEIFRVKHRMDEVEKSNANYKQVFVSLKKLLDEKGIISTEDFEETISLDVILNLQTSNPNSDLIAVLSEDLKKVVN